MVKRLMLPALLAAFSLTAAPKIDNPALNPVVIDTPPAHAPFNLLEHGRDTVAIAADLKTESAAHPVRQSTGNAVKVIQEAFRRCAGLELPVVDPADGAALARYRYLIAVGDSPLVRKLGLAPDQMPREGFAVRTFANGIAIAGYDGARVPGSYDKSDWTRMRINGTQNGAYDFVERFLGVRFYYPGVGTIWPKLTALEIAPVAYRDAPYFPNRFSHSVAVSMRPQNHYPEFGAYEQADWEGRYRMALSTRYWAGHGPSPEALAEAHPDKLATLFYRDPSGHLWKNDKQHIGNYFDVSNLALADLIVADLERYYRSDGADNALWKRGVRPNKDYIVFGQCDTMVSGMDTEPIRKLGLIAPSRRGVIDGELSDVYSRFHIYLAQKIAEKFPGKRLSIMPYHNYVLPPALPQFRKFPENIDVRTCIYDFPNYVPNKEIVAKWRQFHREWREVLGGRPVGSMWLYNEPRIAFGRAIVGRYTGDIPKLLGDDFGKTELFFDYFGDHDWEYYYTYYLVWRAMWNPQFNSDAALAEQWQLLYGPAAPFVREFYDLLRNRWETVMAQKGDRKIAYNPQVLDKLEALLKQAQGAVPADSVEAQRLKLFAKPWPRAIREARGVLAFSKPNYKVVKLAADETIAIDGKGAEKVWSRARAMKFTDPRGSGEAPKRPVDGRLLWDGRGLYGLFRFSGKPEINPAKSLWENDNLEIFYSPGSAMDEYFQFAAGPTPQRHSGQKTLKPMGTPFDSNWPAPGFAAATSVDGDGWTLEFFLPWSALKNRAPDDYGTAFANFIVNRLGSTPECTAYSMTLGNNHNVEQFGFLKFLGKGDL